MNDFYQFFIQELKNIYNAEQQIVKALPGMIRSASSSKLKQALREHLHETKHQVKRLEAIAEDLHFKIKGGKCKPVQDFILEGQKICHQRCEHAAKDAAIIACAQRIEHFEIATYGTLKAFAKHFKLAYVVRLLNETAKEEGHADKVLTKIAEGTLFSMGVNTKACRQCA